MDIKDVLLNSLEESQSYMNKSLNELNTEEFSWSPRPDCNSVIFIYWHVARTEDMWVNRIIKGGNDIYEVDGWEQKLGTPPGEMGYGYDEEKLKSWPAPDIEVLKKYAEAVRETTVNYINSIDEEELSREVALRTRKITVLGSLSHLITEIALHAGQIDYIRGMIKGLNP